MGNAWKKNTYTIKHIKTIYPALPKVPMLLLFNDKDDEFPAQCSVLFEKRAKKFLDMECLAMVGMHFFEYLKAGAGQSSQTS